MSFKSQGSKVFPESGGTPDLARVGSAAVDLLARSGSAASLGRTTSLRSQRSVRRAASNKARSSEQERGLHLGEEEHAAFLAERARREGRQGLRDLLAVYGRMLGPAAIVSVWMFALFAAISYSIPNLLCNRVAKENSGGTFGLTQCIYNSTYTEGGYSTCWGSKLFWLLFWSTQQAWLAGFPGLVCMAMFGPALTKRQRLGIAFTAFLAFLICPIAGPHFGLSINNMWIVLVASIGSLVSVVITSHTVARYTGNPLMRYRWLMLMFLSGGVTTIYLFIMPMLITARSQQALGGMGLTIVRLVVHPAIWSALLMLFRFVLRHIGFVPEMMATVFIIFPMIYASLYGRFLLLQLNNVGSILIMNLVFACFDLAGRIGDRASDGLVLMLMYGDRARDALTSLREHDDKRLAEVFTTSMMENASILAASAILSFGGVAMTAATPPNHALIWMNAGLQIVTTLIFDFMGLVLEGKYHHFEWSRSFAPSVRRLLVYVLILVTLGGSRLCVELVALFCPVYYPDRGIILLEQCDKPSLFQAVSFASQRFTLVGTFFNVTQSSVNS